MAHLLVFWVSPLFATFNFTAAITPADTVMVDLHEDLAAPAPPPSAPENQAPVPVAEEPQGEQPAEEMASPPEPSVGPTEATSPETEPPAAAAELQETAPAAGPPVLRQPPPAPVLIPPLRHSREFISTREELLTYRISLFGMPVGSAELQARNVDGEVRLSLRTRSNAALSNLYPVDDLIETRHMGGNFILTTIKQHEGGFTADTGFCLSLRERNVLWVDRLTSRSVQETVPTTQVLDTLSGLYYLRNRPLQVGVTETLHVYDSEDYAQVPVEVLRRETIRLENLERVATLVVRPAQTSGGIFRRTGDLLLWLTDDDKKVPVRVETRIALGKVTASLVSAEFR